MIRTGDGAHAKKNGRSFPGDCRGARAQYQAQEAKREPPDMAVQRADKPGGDSEEYLTKKLGCELVHNCL